MVWNSLYRPGWPWTQRSACLCLRPGWNFVSMGRTLSTQATPTWLCLCLYRQGSLYPSDSYLLQFCLCLFKRNNFFPDKAQEVSSRGVWDRLGSSFSSALFQGAWCDIIFLSLNFFVCETLQGCQDCWKLEFMSDKCLAYSRFLDILKPICPEMFARSL